MLYLYSARLLLLFSWLGDHWSSARCSYWAVVCYSTDLRKFSRFSKLFLTKRARIRLRWAWVSLGRLIDVQFEDRMRWIWFVSSSWSVCGMMFLILFMRSCLMEALLLHCSRKWSSFSISLIPRFRSHQVQILSVLGTLCLRPNSTSNLWALIRSRVTLDLSE